jgi:hypothetical protein
MDANSPRPDNLNELERRLAAWRPSTKGLSPEAMLFAAGRASAGGGKLWLAWPALCACLAMVSLGLGARLATERSERLALSQQLQERPTESALASTRLPDEKSVPLAPDSYLALRRQWEEHASDLAFGPSRVEGPSNRPGSIPTPVLRPWPLEGPSLPL